MSKTFFASVARISDLPIVHCTTKKVDQSDWKTGDYVVGEAAPVPGSYRLIELTNGRMVEVEQGDLILGALGDRHATLESVGRWRDVGKDLRLNALTAAGVFGKCTSKSSFMAPLLELDYRGHVVVDNKLLNMRDFAVKKAKPVKPIPVILIIGTSMDSGKTLSAKRIIRLLKARGLRVAGAKFTGVGRYRDILAMSDAGADFIADFVDAGLPSTYCPAEEFDGVIDSLLNYLGEKEPDVIVGEAGASPLERYNGALASKQLNDHVVFTLLCASDPYAVLGVMQAFGTKPDLIAGRATCTASGIELVEKLSGIRALDLMNPNSLNELDVRLSSALGL